MIPCWIANTVDASDVQMRLRGAKPSVSDVLPLVVAMSLKRCKLDPVFVFSILDFAFPQPEHTVDRFSLKFWHGAQTTNMFPSGVFLGNDSDDDHDSDGDDAFYHDGVWLVSKEHAFVIVQALAVGEVGEIVQCRYLLEDWFVADRVETLNGVRRFQAWPLFFSYYEWTGANVKCDHHFIDPHVAGGERIALLEGPEDKFTVDNLNDMLLGRHYAWCVVDLKFIRHLRFMPFELHPCGPSRITQHTSIPPTWVVQIVPEDAESDDGSE